MVDQPPLLLDSRNDACTFEQQKSVAQCLRSPTPDVGRLLRFPKVETINTKAQHDIYSKEVQIFQHKLTRRSIAIGLWDVIDRAEKGGSEQFHCGLHSQ